MKWFIGWVFAVFVILTWNHARTIERRDDEQY
jgi:hypothetical protein